MANKSKDNSKITKEKQVNHNFFKTIGSGSLAVLILIGFILVIIVTYTIAFAEGFKTFGINVGIEANNPNDLQSNIGGLAYGIGNNQTPIAECIIYTDEVLISEDECQNQVDCTPNGICLKDIGKCAYFLN